MTDKLITCPPLCGVQLNLRGEPVQWGLVEYVQDVLLRGSNTTPELCDFTLRVMEACPPRGPEQVGAKLRLNPDDHRTLCGLTKRDNGLIGPENIVASAKCHRAILLAVDALKPEAVKAAE